MDSPSLDSPRTYSYPPASLNQDDILGIFQRSPDNGITLVFSKMNLSNVGAAATETIVSMGMKHTEGESSVKRITLGHNHLTALPTEFVLLSRLRYLNLKHNNFSIFPDVLTLMPSLDTLDISHNKIRGLPTQAGQLVHLRVFCFSRNKVARLPSYLSQFRHLEVLQIDRNPIEWPPRSVIKHPASLDSGQAMKAWIKSIQSWIETSITAKARENDGHNKQYDIGNHSTDSYSWRFPIEENELDEGFSPHNRSLSQDSTLSISSATESVRDVHSSSSVYGHAHRPNPLRLGSIQPYSDEASPTHSLESYLPSPVSSDGSLDTMGISLVESQHIRNISHGGGLRSTQRSERLGKQSMPNLRAKPPLIKKIPETRPAIVTPVKTNAHDLPFHFSPRQDSGLYMESSGPSNLNESIRLSFNQSVSSMQFERNSYFRRVLALPALSLPKPLLVLVESARSILFAICQVYQTLVHCMIHVIDDRLSSVLRKVLDPAGADIMQLISSLDRFDAMSWKNPPPPAVCRNVIESCRDAVTVFSQAVGVFSLQLKVMGMNDDVRYPRWMLLELYAASAEISCAWQAVVPYVDAVRPFLRVKPFSAQPPLHGGESEVLLPVPAAAPIERETASSRAHSGTGAHIGSENIGKVRTARRHAGSFSYKDVEIGKKLPSYDDAPTMLGGVISRIAGHTPTLRAPKQTTGSLHAPSTSTSPIPSTLITTSATSPIHSRQGSHISLQTSSSPSVPQKSTFLDLPSNSRFQVDKEAVQAVQMAVNVAPAVWDMIEEMVGIAPDMKSTLQETLGKARVVTRKLSDSVRSMQGADSAADIRILREDAHMFLKTVVQISSIIKAYRDPHIVSPALRTNMVKLTNSTEEFAILLHVSSFSPSPSRSYSPMLNISITSGSTNSEDSRFASNLSRSRSAQPSASFKLSPSHQDSPHSALSTQSFNIPIIKRMRDGGVGFDVDSA